MKYLSAPTQEKKSIGILENSYYDRGRDFKGDYNNSNFYISKNIKNDINICENYISENFNNTSTFNIFNNTCKQNLNLDSKLHDQLIRKRKERSSCYNFLLLTTFNLNISHFCFPFLLSQVGLINLIGILIICGFFSYLVHSGLIEFVSSNKDIANLNFADIIKCHFGSFCAGFVEIGMILWFMYSILNFYITCKLFYKISEKFNIFFLVLFWCYRSKFIYF